MARNTAFFMHQRAYFIARQGGGAAATPGPPPFTFVAPTFSITAGTADVRCVVPDGSGGYYVGGDFDTITDSVGSHSRLRIAHLDADGLVTAWDPGSDTIVFDIKVIDANRVAVAKLRSSTITSNTLGGFDCQGFGIVDRLTGIAVSWDPAVTANCYSLAVNGIDLYVGRFGSPGILKFDVDAQTGGTFATANSTVLHVRWDGSLLAAGSFTTVNGTARAKYAEVDASGVLTAWDAQATVSGNGTGLIISGSDVVLAGVTLTAVNSGGTVAKGATIVDKATALATGFVQDVEVNSTRANQVLGLFVTSDYIFASCSGLSFNPDLARLYDRSTGITVTSFTATGDLDNSFTGTNHIAPSADRAIVIGQLTDITPNKESGAACMFVISYP